MPMRSLALVALLALGGCVSAVTDPMGSQRALEDTQRRYTHLIRWGEIAKAEPFVDPALREEFREHAPAFEDLRITDFEIDDWSFDPENDELATFEVTYHGYSLSTLIEKKIRETQTWYREDSIQPTWRVRPQIREIADAIGARH